MKGKIRRYSFLLLGLVLLLASSLVSCGESYTQVELDTAEKAGYAEGYDAGQMATRLGLLKVTRLVMLKVRLLASPN